MTGHRGRPAVGPIVGRIVERKIIHAPDDTRWPSALGVSLHEMSQFVDECQLNARGGDGGAGCVSFRREGPGGLRRPERRRRRQRRRRVAGGRPQRVVPPRLPRPPAPTGRQRRPRQGQGPPRSPRSVARDRRAEGTAVLDLYTNELLAELVHHGDRWLAAAGGRGGRGQRQVPLEQAPGPELRRTGRARRGTLVPARTAAHGRRGPRRLPQRREVARSSASSRRRSRRSPTTRSPRSSRTSASCKLDDDTEFVVADIPGLIEGASEGRGLGHQFLRHVERARVMCVLVDLAVDGRGPARGTGTHSPPRVGGVPARTARPAADRGRHQGRRDPWPTGTALATPIMSASRRRRLRGGRLAGHARRRGSAAEPVGRAWSSTGRWPRAPSSSAWATAEFRLVGRDAERAWP